MKRPFAIATLILASSLISGSVYAQCQTKEECEELKEYEAFLKQYQQEVDQFQKTQLEEWQSYMEQTRKEFDNYVASVQQVWGDQTKISDKKNWVEYSDDLSRQVQVDYENNQIIIKDLTGLSQSDFQKQLQSEIGRLLKQTKKTANKDNPLKKNLNKIASPNEKAIVSHIDKIFNKHADEEPEVLSEVKELTGEANVEKQAEKLAEMASIESQQVSIIQKPSEWMFASALPGSLLLAKGTTQKKAMVAKINLSEKWTTLRAKKYQAYVDAFSKEWDIEPKLIYSIMYNESSFNPVAISPIPAYGLMQVVPESAGMDVAQRHFSSEVVFSPDFLFEPKNNIAIGVGYLNLLDARYFRKIENPINRMYCVIAAYNTGPGNVARALTNTKKLNLAVAAANKMSADEVYSRLINDLPYDETKNYLRKVAGSVSKFETM